MLTNDCFLIPTHFQRIQLLDAWDEETFIARIAVDGKECRIKSKMSLPTNSSQLLCRQNRIAAH